MNSSVGQLELALLRAHLHSFERRFYDLLGPRYIQLDEARAQAAQLRARYIPTAHKDAIAARQLVRQSAEECENVSKRPPADPDKLKKLQRELARAFHPDLEPDEARQAVRQRLMVEVNLAYQDADIRRLRLLEQALERDETGDAARQLAELVASPINELRERVEYATRHDKDLLRQLSGYLLKQMEEAFQMGPRLIPVASRFSNLVERARADLGTLSSSRQLQFSELRNMGEISIRAMRDIDAPLTPVGKAQGLVNVPHGKAVILRLSNQCKDLKQLEKLDPGDLQGFIDEWPDFVNFRDDDLLPLARFRGMEMISLGRTEITGRVFDKFPTLHELRVLILDETSFDDAGLMRLEECVWMQRLDLSFTQVTGTGVRAIHNMTALRELNLYGTDTHDEDLFVLDRIPGLRSLNLGLTSASDACGQHLRHLSHLEVLNMGGTKITDAIMDTILQLPALRELVLWETAITDAGLNRIKLIKTLEYVDVDQTQVTPAGLQAFRPARPEVKLPSDIWAES